MYVIAVSVLGLQVGQYWRILCWCWTSARHQLICPLRLCITRSVTNWSEGREFLPERLQCLQCDNPRRNAGRLQTDSQSLNTVGVSVRMATQACFDTSHPYPILAVEGTKWCHFPLLYVPCAPVVQEDKAEDVVIGFISCNRLPELVASAHKGSLLRQRSCSKSCGASSTGP